jgi:MOSC domain-containing protein YiiM
MIVQLLSVNIGIERTLRIGSQLDETGIFKIPASAPVAVTLLGLAGDVIKSTQHHGGVDQAVYIYGGADYAWWSQELGQTLAPGTFGDNLTISDLESAALKIGDVLHVGAVRLQVTAPRIPCSKLAARMGDPKFVKRFRAAERPGVYCRVLQTGSVQTGDAVSIEPYQGAAYSVLEMFRSWYIKDLSEADIRLQLAAPIAVRSRKEMEERLAKQ